MTLGPLEYTVIGFEGNNFDGSIADELSRVIDSGVIADRRPRLRAARARTGTCASSSSTTRRTRASQAFAPMLQGLTGLLTEEDIQEIGGQLEPNTSALVIMFEHRWAVRLKEAIGNAGGFLVARETIRPESLEMLNAEIEAAGQLSA